MAIPTISHTFYDFEIERHGSPDEIYFVKVLSVDGRRFLVIKQPSAQTGASTSLIVVQNWFEELKRSVPAVK